MEKIWRSLSPEDSVIHRDFSLQFTACKKNVCSSERTRYLAQQRDRRSDENYLHSPNSSSLLSNGLNHQIFCHGRSYLLQWSSNQVPGHALKLISCSLTIDTEHNNLSLAYLKVKASDPVVRKLGEIKQTTNRGFLIVERFLINSE